MKPSNKLIFYFLLLELFIIIPLVFVKSPGPWGIFYIFLFWPLPIIPAVIYWVAAYFIYGRIIEKQKLVFLPILLAGIGLLILISIGGFLNLQAKRSVEDSELKIINTAKELKSYLDNSCINNGRYPTKETFYKHVGEVYNGQPYYTFLYDLICRPTDTAELERCQNIGNCQDFVKDPGNEKSITCFMEFSYKGGPSKRKEAIGTYQQAAVWSPFGGGMSYGYVVYDREVCKK